MADPEPPGQPATPRWVKAFAILAFIVFLLFFILMFAGGRHGPRRHMTFSSTGDQRSHSSQQPWR